MREGRGKFAVERGLRPVAWRLLAGAALAALHGLPAASPAVAQDVDYADFADSDAFNALAEAGGLKATGAFPFDFQFLAFRGGAPSEAHVWAAASVHAGRVRGVFSGGWKYSLSLGIELLRGDSVVASNAERLDFALNTRVPEHVSDGFPVQARVTVPPGEYDYRLVVKDLNWPDDRSVNVREGRVTVPSFEGRRPLVSSIAIAADSGGHWSPAHGVELKLNAAAIITRSARPYIYYEVYGLTPGGRYRGDVRLVSTWVSRGTGDEFRGTYQPFQMQYRGTAPTDPAEPVRAVLRLDASQTEPGPYEVQVRVTDVESGARSEQRKAKLKVRQEDARRPSIPITELEVVEDGGGGEGT